MRKELTINLHDADHLSPVDRYLFIIAKLNAEGFKFAEVFDLFPAEVDLAKPYEMRTDGPNITFVQDTVN